MQTFTQSKLRNFSLYWAVALIAFVIMSLPLPALAQSVQVEQQQGSVSDFIGMVITILIGGGILLFARRDMRGWDQPISYVLFSLDGRLNRKPYWLIGVVLLNILVYLAMFVVGLITLLMAMVLPSDSIIIVGTWFVIIIPLFLLMTWAGIALGVKRLHDRNRSGWMMLLMLVPLVNIWIGIEIMFLKGTAGANNYGFDPLDAYDWDGPPVPAGSGGAGGGEEQAVSRTHNTAQSEGATGSFGHSGRGKKPFGATSEGEPQPVKRAYASNSEMIRDRLGLGPPEEET